MSNSKIKIIWPNGEQTLANPGDDWLEIANKAGIKIPTGCLSGSCGACEIDVNGSIVRACINSVPMTNCRELRVEFYYDPFW